MTVTYRQAYEYGKDVLPATGKILLLYVVIIGLRAVGITGYWVLYAVMLSFTLGFKLYQVYYKKEAWKVKEFAKSIAILLGTITVILLVFHYAGRWGFYGILGAFVVMAIYRLCGRKAYRENYKKTIERLISMIWGVEFTFKEYGSPFKVLFKKEKAKKKLPRIKFTLK